MRSSSILLALVTLSRLLVATRSFHIIADRKAIRVARTARRASEIPDTKDAAPGEVFRPYHHQQQLHLSTRRRSLVTVVLSGLSTSAIPFPRAAIGASSSSSSEKDDEDVVRRLVEAREALASLLENWEKATVDCTYADVPRELLEQKNKKELLEKASTFALFDKSAAVVSCKTTNRVVRDYIGVTGKGPLVGAEKRMLKRTVVANRVDPDALEEYYDEVESFSRSLSNAATLSYTAGVADFDSVNNFSKGKEAQESSNLEQSQKAIAEALGSLDKILGFLQRRS